MTSKESKRHIRRLERLRRENLTRTGYAVLWALLAVFLLGCLYVVMR